MERTKYSESTLHLVTFGPVGQRLETVVLDSLKYTEAVADGQRLVEDPASPVESFAVLRVLYNSSTPRGCQAVSDSDTIQL